jgi:hypothetical protein
MTGVMEEYSGAVTFLWYHIQMVVMDLKNQIFDLRLLANPE